MTHSYHIFMFPFRWTIEELKDKTFGEQISFNHIRFEHLQNWERVWKQESKEQRIALYNERNYFYEFVHDALYDKGVNDNTNIVRHYERKEPSRQNVKYVIKTHGFEYELKLEYLNLNIYSTGVGVLSFYLCNEHYTNPDDILKINQYGRRVYPPFYADKECRSEIAEVLRIEGLNGVYEDDFSGYEDGNANLPSDIIRKMVREVASNISIKSVIDDRMYVMSWYKNDVLANQFHQDLDGFKMTDFWYKYVFVDGNYISCSNDKMQRDLVDGATYERWQKQHSLYANSRYSFMLLTNTTCPKFLTDYFETEYARMAELILVQKASVLRFSAEVTNISSMEQGDQLPAKVSSLYKEYIRFVNQIHFREVSAQDQAIEIYDMLYKTAKLEDHVKKLDEEIDELYEYVSLAEDRKNSRTMSWLTTVATLFVPATVITAFFGMNNAYNSEGLDGFWNKLPVQLMTVVFGVVILILIYKCIIQKKGGKR